MASNTFANVVHFSPGRVRVRLQPQYRTPETFQQLEGYLAIVPGITAVDTNISSGSVLIRYDPQAISTADLIQVGRSIGLGMDNYNPQGPSEASNWASAIDKGRIASTLVILGVATLGGFLGPYLGLSARVGSISAAGAVLLGKRYLRGRLSNHRPSLGASPQA